MSLTKMMKSSMLGLHKIEQIGSVIFLLLIIFVVTYQMIGRAFLAVPVAWTPELAQAALVWLVFLSSAIVMAEGTHITIKIIDLALPPFGRLLFDIFSVIITLLMVSVLVPDAYRYTARMHYIGAPASDLPSSLFVSAALCGFVLIALGALRRIVRVVKSGSAAYQEVDLVGE